MNMVMNNDGSGNIMRLNALLPPHEWDNDLKENIAKNLNLNKDAIRTSGDIGLFDVIVTNPPFGSKVPIKDTHILQQFELAFNWKQNDNGKWVKKNELQNSVPPEILFIERCHQLLKPGGRLAIVLPDSILGNPSLGYIRQWLIKNSYIIASVDLHEDAFQPRNGTQTSVLFTRKKTKREIENEEKQNQIVDYDVFMAMIERIGHDKRGNPIFKRDKQGKEILVPEDKETFLLRQLSDGTQTSQTLSKTKVLDDQTAQVPRVFHNWKKEEGIVW